MGECEGVKRGVCVFVRKETKRMRKIGGQLREEIFVSVTCVVCGGEIRGWWVMCGSLKI